MENVLYLFTQTGSIPQLRSINPHISLFPIFKSDGVAILTSSKDQVFSQTWVRSLRIENKARSFHSSDGKLFLFGERVNYRLFLGGLLSFPCFHLCLKVMGVSYLIELLMGFFIRVIPIDTQILSGFQVIDRCAS